MNSIIRKFVATAALAIASFGASAGTLTFDDLTGTHYFDSNVPYQGLSFGAVPVGPCQCSPGSWFWSDDNTDKNYFKSPSTSVSTYTDPLAPSYGESQGIKSATPIVFNGAYFTALDDGIDITFDLYLAGNLVWTSSTLTLDYATAATFLPSGYSGAIDEIRVKAWQGYFAMDDMNIPEPGSYGLVMAALGGLAFTARRRRDDKA
jgi:hypothetical protein